MERNAVLVRGQVYFSQWLISPLGDFKIDMAVIITAVVLGLCAFLFAMFLFRKADLAFVSVLALYLQALSTFSKLKLVWAQVYVPFLTITC